MKSYPPNKFWLYMNDLKDIFFWFLHFWRFSREMKMIWKSYFVQKKLHIIFTWLDNFFELGFLTKFLSFFAYSHLCIAQADLSVAKSSQTKKSILLMNSIVMIIIWTSEKQFALPFVFPFSYFKKFVKKVFLCQHFRFFNSLEGVVLELSSNEKEIEFCSFYYSFQKISFERVYVGVSISINMLEKLFGLQSLTTSLLTRF